MTSRPSCTPRAPPGSQGRDHHPWHDVLELRQSRRSGLHLAVVGVFDRAAAVPHRRTQLLHQPGAACRRHRADHARVRSRPRAAIAQRSRAPHQRVFRRAIDLSVHGAASFFRHFRLQPSRDRWRRRRADAGAASESVGATRRRPAAGLWHDRDQSRGDDARSRGRRTQGRLLRPDGTDADVGELGELWVKGPNITPGYWNRPDANASSFTDGWLHTGDAARIDDEGFYYIVDRWKDMYISGGENVYPAEVENVLHQLTAIAEAAVIGIPSEQWGEVGMAIIAMKPGHSITEAEIDAHCEANLARFKRPRVIKFVDALPRNATGKIHKPTLRKNFISPEVIDVA